MEFKVLKETDPEFELINGTCLQGQLNVPYENIVKCFGESLGPSEDQKVSNQWIILITDNEEQYIASIYDWKVSNSYVGGIGLEKEDIKTWHIGGNSPNVVCMIQQILS